MDTIDIMSFLQDMLHASIRLQITRYETTQGPSLEDMERVATYFNSMDTNLQVVSHLAMSQSHNTEFWSATIHALQNVAFIIATLAFLPNGFTYDGQHYVGHRKETFHE